VIMISNQKITTKELRRASWERGASASKEASWLGVWWSKLDSLYSDDSSTKPLKKRKKEKKAYEEYDISYSFETNINRLEINWRRDWKRCFAKPIMDVVVVTEKRVNRMWKPNYVVKDSNGNVYTWRPHDYQ